MRRPRPLPGPPDATLHMIIARHRRGAYAAERDVGDLGREATIADIMNGQVEDVEQVIAWILPRVKAIAAIWRGAPTPPRRPNVH